MPASVTVKMEEEEREGNVEVGGASRFLAARKEVTTLT